MQGLKTGLESGGTIMLVNATIGGKDAVDPVDALDDKHVMDVFGPVFSPVQITGVIFLKKCNGGVGEGVGTLTGFFNGARVSASMRAVNVSVGSYKKGVYLTEMHLGQADPATNTMTFAIMGFEKPRK